MSGNPDLDTTAKRSGLRMGHSRRHHTAVRNPVKWSAHQNPRPVLARSPEWWGHSSRSNRGSDWGRRRYWSVVGGGCKGSALRGRAGTVVETRFPDAPRGSIEKIVHSTHAHFANGKVRDFVPLLVERNAREAPMLAP
ncbi:three-helix bundle dimerization domain-containing protein [Rhodococcus koreensis]